MSHLRLHHLPNRRTYLNSSRGPQVWGGGGSRICCNFSSGGRGQTLPTSPRGEVAPTGVRSNCVLPLELVPPNYTEDRHQLRLKARRGSHGMKCGLRGCRIISPMRIRYEVGRMMRQPRTVSAFHVGRVHLRVERGWSWSLRRRVSLHKYVFVRGLVSALRHHRRRRPSDGLGIQVSLLIFLFCCGSLGSGSAGSRSWHCGRLPTQYLGLGRGSARRT